MTRTRLYAFVSVFLLAVALLSFGPLCLLVECNLQATIHGQVTSETRLTVDNGLVTLTGPVSPAVRQLTTALLPPGIRTVTALWRGGMTAAARLWEQLLPSASD